MKNLIETQLTSAERTQIDSLIAQLEAALEGKLTALTEDERSRYGSINEQNKLLVNKVREYRQNNPAMSSPDVDWDEFETDYQSRVFLESRSDRLKSLVYQMQSTKILHDNDNYQDALNDYAYAQYKKGANEAGYAEKVAEIKQFFPKSGKTAPPDGGNNG
jgi:hypothetical protein